MPREFKWVGMSEDGGRVVLERFSGNFRQVPPIDPARVRRGAVLDVETTGTDRTVDSIIELGIRFFQFDRETGEVVGIDEPFVGLQDPGRPLSDEIVRLTGLTDDDLRGQMIDWKKVGERLADVDIIIAHNAAFDRPFVDRMCPESIEKVWGCSLQNVDWDSKGYPAKKLEILCIFHGFYIDAHRALSDAEALLHLLSFREPESGLPYLKELLTNAKRPFVRIAAAGAPFETKDLLKRRGYRWDNPNRVWKRTIYGDRLEEERAWMESNIYHGPCRAVIEEIRIQDHFKTV